MLFHFKLSLVSIYHILYTNYFIYTNMSNLSYCHSAINMKNWDSDSSSGRKLLQIMLHCSRFNCKMIKSCLCACKVAGAKIKVPVLRPLHWEKKSLSLGINSLYPHFSKPSKCVYQHSIYLYHFLHQPPLHAQ